MKSSVVQQIKSNNESSVENIDVSYNSGIQLLYDGLLSKRSNIFSILKDTLTRKALMDILDVIYKHILASGKIIVAGNGGSASQSQHLCSELMGRLKDRRSPIRALSLCSDISLLTCIANDFGYERIFSRQIEGLGDSNDVFIAFTTSGASRNIIEALLECKSKGICTIVFTGRNTDAIQKIADYIVDVPLKDSTLIQEVHMQLIHILCELLENKLNDEPSIWDSVLSLGQQGYKYLILDRDGVINNIKANGYVQQPSEFILRHDFLDCIQELSNTFQFIFVVTNQKGVGKGIMTMEELESVHTKMIDTITNHGGRIDKIYVSTSPDPEANETKPNTGLADKIKEDYPCVDFIRTVVVGDSASDYLFANNLNCKFIYARTR